MNTTEELQVALDIGLTKFVRPDGHWIRPVLTNPAQAHRSEDSAF